MTARRPLDHFNILEMESARFHFEGTHVSRSAIPLHLSVCWILRTIVALSLWCIFDRLFKTAQTAAKLSTPKFSLFMPRYAAILTAFWTPGSSAAC